MRDINKILWSIAIKLQNELVLAAPFNRGNLSASIRVVPGGKGLIISMIEDGKYVEFGTPPHIIRAKEGGVLHWHKTKGRTQHYHPHSKVMQEDTSFESIEIGNMLIIYYVGRTHDSNVDFRIYDYV